MACPMGGPSAERLDGFCTGDVVAGAEGRSHSLLQKLLSPHRGRICTGRLGGRRICRKCSCKQLRKLNKGGASRDSAVLSSLNALQNEPVWIASCEHVACESSGWQEELDEFR